jgi:hypothetical protein
LIKEHDNATTGTNLDNQRNANAAPANRFGGGFGGGAFGREINTINAHKILSYLNKKEEFTQENMVYKLHDFDNLTEKNCNELFDSEFVYVGTISDKSCRDLDGDVFFKHVKVAQISSEITRIMMVLNLTKREFQFVKLTENKPTSGYDHFEANDGHFILHKLNDNLIQFANTTSN